MTSCVDGYCTDTVMPTTSENQRFFVIAGMTWRDKEKPSLSPAQTPPLPGPTSRATIDS